MAWYITEIINCESLPLQSIPDLALKQKAFKLYSQLQQCLLPLICIYSVAAIVQPGFLSGRILDQAVYHMGWVGQGQFLAITN